MFIVFKQLRIFKITGASLSKYPLFYCELIKITLELSNITIDC